MGQIRALFVGVNTYPSDDVADLRGCVNDVTAARRLIEERSGGTAVTLTLTDGQATVAAVTDAIERFLGGAGQDDTALLWFAGHGTWTVASDADLLVEATGRNQAVLCVDGPLPDKRLGALLESVAARGADTVAVLDCCFSGGATRDPDPAPGVRTRYAPWPRGPVPGPRDHREAVVDGSGQRHLLLAASRLDQPSNEYPFDGRSHGAFSYALILAARAAGPSVTYRQLLAAAEARVRGCGAAQQPVLFPERPSGPADRIFLGGSAPGRTGDHLLRHGPDGWEVDCGAVHGLGAGDGQGATEFTPLPTPDEGDGAGSGGRLRVRAVRERLSLVDPVGWTPDRDRAYPVVVSALALPPATVSVRADPGTAELIRAAVAGYGPGGGPSPLLRVVEHQRDWAGLHFRLVAREGSVVVLGRDGTPFVDPLPVRGADDARRVVDCLSHLTRWHRLRDLESGPSTLGNAVRLEVVPWGEDEPLLPDGAGEIVRRYRPADGPGPREPWVSIRLRNRTHRPLWCVLLDMTDSYASDPQLFPGHFVGPGGVGHALDGAPVALRLPAHRPAEPGAECRDWLKLFVAEAELNTVPFCMDRWDPAAPPAARQGPQDGWTGVLRLGPEGSRDLGAAAPGAPRAVRWATRTVPLRTVVPAEHEVFTGRGA